jgi:isocitrate dehydrogenase (NAD+)
MTLHRVTLIRGDGIGPEIAEVARKCIDTTGVKIDWDLQDAGMETMAREGTPLPERVVQSIRNNKIALKAPITTPVGTGFRSVNVELRKELDLYACVRPCKSLEGISTYCPQAVDLVIFRENTEDLYAGFEFQKGTGEAREVVEFLNRYAPKKIRTDSGLSVKTISVYCSERIARAAFEYARANKRRKVTVVHKANIMKFTDGLFLKTVQDVSHQFPDIEFEERIVDNMCVQLIRNPQDYDVIVLTNLYGDIVSDLCAGLVGGLGVAPGANIGRDAAVFEAVHGSAPQLKGLNKANPTALILSGVLMLRYMNENTAADRLEAAVARVIREGKSVTGDLKGDRDDLDAVGTKEMGQAIIDQMNT